MTPTDAKIATPQPTQQNSVMQPVGTPQAAHLGPPVGIPSGPSNAELMAQIQMLTARLEQQTGGQAQVAAETEPEEKTYYHQTPGSTIVITRRGRNGEHIPEVVAFNAKGELTTSDPIIQDFLDEIVDAPGVPVYSKSAPELNRMLQEAAAVVKEAAARTIDKLGAEAGAVNR